MESLTLYPMSLAIAGAMSVLIVLIVVSFILKGRPVSKEEVMSVLVISGLALAIAIVFNNSIPWMIANAVAVLGLWLSDGHR